MNLNLERNFSRTTNLTHKPFNIKANQNTTTKYDNKSLKSLSSHIWNSLQKDIKEILITISSNILLVNGLV